MTTMTVMMRIVYLVVSLLWSLSAVSAQPQDGAGGEPCEVCGGPLRAVSTPNVEVTVGENTTRTCADVQSRADDGLLTDAVCAALTELFATENPCSCELLVDAGADNTTVPRTNETDAGSNTTTASDAPSDVPSMAPSAADGTPTGAMAPPSLMPAAAPSSLPTAADGSTCDICGPGREVGAPDKGIIFEGQSITCEQLQEFGKTGLILIDVCVSVISVFETQDPCLCQDEGSGPGTTPPSPTVPPTSSANTSSFMSSFVVFASMLAAATISSLLLLN
jgi:hypothetical protein